MSAAAVVEVAAEGVVLEAPGVLVAHRAKMPMTLNLSHATGKNPWGTRNELKDWRNWARQASEGLEPLTPPVAITVAHLRKNRASMPDAGAPILAVKAVLDGLIDAGVLPDDGPDYVVELLFLAPIVVGWQGLRVTLAEVPL